jgi:hypothetical protein
MADYADLIRLEKKTQQPKPLSSTPSPKGKLNTGAIQHKSTKALTPSPMPTQQPEVQSSTSPTRKEMQKTIETNKIEQTNETTMKRINERLNVRKKIRHTFDIYDDQLLSLREISINREKVFGDRVLLGDLVQEALDMFITKERNKE